jgi:hypothetical protein
MGAALAAALAAMPGVASADDMQISIDGLDLFPTAGNTASAVSGPLDIAIAIGNGASADGGLLDLGTPPSFFDFAFADGASGSALAGGGSFDSAIVIGANSTAEAGGNFACLEFCPPPDNSDLAAVFGNNLHATATGGSFLTTIDQAPAAAAAPSDLNPFEDLFGTAGINTWTPSADSFLASSDPILAASLDTSVDNFWSGAGGVGSSGDDPLTNLVAEVVGPGAFAGGEINAPDSGISDLAVGLDYSVFASGLAPTLDPGLSEFVNSFPTISSDALFLLFFPEDLLGLISLG